MKSLKIKNFRRALIIFHFIIVVIGVAHFNNRLHWKPLINFTNTYYFISYTNKSFAFFSNGIKNDYRLKLQLSRKKDTSQRVFKLPGDNNEVNIRYKVMLWNFSAQTPATKYLYARSWADYCIQKDSDLSKVTVTVYENQLPTLKAYSQGRRLSSKGYYNASFNVN